MRDQFRFCFLFLISCSFFLTSCFTGKEYHHPRVRIEPSPQKTEFIQTSVLSFKSDSLKPVATPIDKETQLTDHKKINLGISRKANRIIPSKLNITPQKHLTKNTMLKKAHHSKRFRFGDAAEAIFAILFFLIIGLPSILLLIAGFIMGFFGIMVGFWICWIIGFLGIIFACIVYIAIWASSGDEGIWGTIFYLFFFLLAIAFILIVLLI